MSESGRGDVPASVSGAERCVAALIGAGIRDFVVSPGSRSAPLALAALAAEACSAARVTVAIDERAAGFWALGHAQARAAGESMRPVALVVTSGTAAAELMPATVEAAWGDVPLVLITADRPHELRATGANQTVDHPAILSGVTRLSVDLPAASTDDDPAWTGVRLRSLAARVVSAATGSVGQPAGPVHLNIGLREPLAVTDGAADAAQASSERMAALLAGSRPVLVGSQIREAPDAKDGPGRWQCLSGGSETDLQSALEAVGSAEQGVIVAGAGASLEQVAALSAARGWPVLAEIVSGCVGLPLAISNYRQRVDELLGAGSAPQVVVQCGRPTLSRHAPRLFSAAAVAVVIGPTDGRWTDPQNAADLVLDAVPHQWLQAEPEHPRSLWRTQWLAEVTSPPAVQASHPAVPLDGEAAMRATLQAAAGQVLVVGASRAIRLADELAPRGDLAALPARVISNRGAAGIDGTIATVWGAAASATGSRVFAVVGDVTFAHDVGALFARSLQPPATATTIVVLDDGGGQIFASLEHGVQARSGPQAQAAFDRVMRTAPALDIGAVCGAAGLPCREVRTAPELDEALKAPASATGIQVVWARLHGKPQVSSSNR